ncbi:MAG: hypothetical protein KKG33_00655 [candidate division Zixibacteria bacterium]|nr:hypothetical protein [candidate division Zixibacteria bacterium]MBU1472027.1 hypothetical protein [candidate division Zixibacteria bacterium]MBU2624050.1 hypothetical protein [candidate division Zixibacteria bacterium]
MKSLSSITILATIGLLLICVNVILAEGDASGTVIFEPIDTVESAGTDFPFAAELSFLQSPVVGDTSTLHVKFTAARQVADTLAFRIRALPSEYVVFGAEQFSWPTPQAGKPLEVDIPMTFLLGGNFYIAIEQFLPHDKIHSLYQLEASFGIDGKSLSFGKHPSPISNCPGNFHTNNMNEIRIVRKNRFEGPSRRRGIPFDVELSISPIPRIDSVSTVTFKVTTNTNFVHNIQFQWVYLPTVQIDSLAQSWEARPRTGDTYSGTFDLTPKRAGYAVINFKIFGKNATTRVTSKSYLDIPLRMVFDSEGTMLYFGETDIWDCNFPESDALGKQLADVLIFEKERSQYVKMRSQPDFEEIEKESAAESDTTTAKKAIPDSVLKNVRTKSQIRDSLRALEKEKSEQ